MIVRRTWFIAVALLFSVGCSDRGGPQLGAETDDPFYVQGVQLKRQGRNPEALTAFLKVIEKRGDRGAAESHLEAGQIYLHHIKDPVFAYYHFKKFLELQPNSPQTELVRGQVGAALREFAKTVPGRPPEDQSVRLKAEEEASVLRREVEQLRAELAVLRGGGAAPVQRPARMITVPTQAAAITAPSVPTATVVDSPVIPAPTPVTNRAAATTPPPTRASPPRPAPGGATHTVAPKETWFAISKRYGVKMEDLAAANGLSINAPLKIGTVLKIPTAAPAGR